MNLLADITTFFTDFAVEASYNGASIRVIFDASCKLVNALTGGIESTGPQAICQSADVEGAQHGEQIVINDTAYYIIGIEPDGAGITVLTLSKDA